MSAVKVSREEPPALLEMDFRGKLNLLDAEAIGALGPAVPGLEGSGGPRVVVLSAPAGKAFAGGVDLAAMRDLAPRYMD